MAAWRPWLPILTQDGIPAVIEGDPVDDTDGAAIIIHREHLDMVYGQDGGTGPVRSERYIFREVEGGRHFCGHGWVYRVHVQPCKGDSLKEVNGSTK